MLNFKIISKIISFDLFIISTALFVCIGIASIYSESTSPFIYSDFITLTLGLILLLASRGVDKKKEIHLKDSFFTVTFSWIIMGLVGSLPYIFSGTIPSFIDALFESVSGFTTTGSSILNDIEILPKSILFWRSLTHWIGGIGIIILVIVILPALKVGGYHLFMLESSLQEKIKPRIRQVGNRLLMIYISLTVLETIFLLLGNMNLFESVCHSFGTIATGGFSPKNTSIAGYSPYIQYVIMIFMLLAATNFLIHYYFIKAKFSKIKQNEEFKFFLSVILILGSIITASLFFNMNKPFEEAFREAFFQIISIISCTGFATADYLQWPVFTVLILFFAMFLGGSTGSTAGGIKMVRHLILLKNLNVFFKQLLHPHSVSSLKLNNNRVSNETNNSIMSFISVYLLVFLIGSLLLVIIGVDGKTASSSVATCMAGIGPGIGTVGPVSNFAHLPDLAKVLLTFLMIVGRLEIYTVLVLFTKRYWRK